jgi:hypothetical protein
MEAWEAKHQERGTKPSAKAREQVYLELGGRFGDPSALCWPESNRDRCNRFKCF